MSSGVNPNNRRRVRSNQLVGEIPKSAGVRGAARETSAMGSLYGRSNVYVAQPNEEVNLWGNISRTLGNVMAKLQTNKAEEDAEAKRLRLKQEALEEERQRLMGQRMGNEIHRTLIEGVVTGGITDSEEADAYAFSMLEQVAPVMGTPFYNAAYETITNGLNFVGVEFNKKIEAQYLTNASTTIAYSMNNVLLNFDSNTQEERRAAVKNAIAFGTQAGLPLAQVQSHVANTYLSTARTMLMSGRISAAVGLCQEMLSSGVATSLPPDEHGRLGPEVVGQLLQSYSDDVIKREEAIEQKDRINKGVEQDANFGTFLVNIAQATDLNQLQELQDKLQSTPTEDVIQHYGTSASALWKSLAVQQDFILTGRTPAGNREAMDELDERIRNNDRTLLDEPTALDAYTDRLTPAQLSHYRSTVHELRSAQDPDENSMIAGALSRLTGYFTPAAGTPGPPPAFVGLTLVGESISETGKSETYTTQAGFAVRDILQEALRDVNPADYENDPLGLRAARLKAIQEAEDRIRSGSDRRFLDVANAERQLNQQPELLITARYYDFDRDIRNNPAVREALTRAVIKPNARVIDVERTIRDFNDPKTQEFLRHEYRRMEVVPWAVKASKDFMDAAVEVERLEASIASMSEMPDANIFVRHRWSTKRNAEIDTSAEAQRRLMSAAEILAIEEQIAATNTPAEFAPTPQDLPLIENSMPPREETK